MCKQGDGGLELTGVTCYYWFEIWKGVKEWRHLVSNETGQNVVTLPKQKAPGPLFT